MGVCYSIVRDDIGQRFELGKGHWREIFGDSLEVVALSQNDLAERISSIRPEEVPQDAARRIIAWSGGAPVRLITDDKLEAGPELDALVHEMVMGLKPPAVLPTTADQGARIEWVPPKYSTDNGDALAVVEHFRWLYLFRSDEDVRVDGKVQVRANQWEVCFVKGADRDKYALAFAFPLAVCRAALKAVGAR